jgi:uncharacterized OB-fold protein
MAAEISYSKPVADWETRAFWEGCGRHELVLQRCRDCQTVQFRPRAVCASCLSSSIEHFVASGRGNVYTFTVTHQNNLPGFREACPYVLAYVELDEGPQLMTHIVGCEVEDVRVGMPVTVEFVDLDRDPAKDAARGIGAGTAIPRFRPS